MDLDPTEAVGVTGAGIQERQEGHSHRAQVRRKAKELRCRSTSRARGYWVSIVGHNEAAVPNYIQDQEEEDQRLDPLGWFQSQSRFERLQD